MIRDVDPGNTSQEVKVRSAVDQILADINSVSVTESKGLRAFASELAAGVTAEREAEIAGALPFPYTILLPATAQIDDEKIRVPRMVIATATLTPGNDWITSTAGRRQRREKAACAVGVHTLVENEYVTVLSIVILWRRVK